MAEYIKLEDAIKAIRANGVYGPGHSDDERENDVINTLEAVPLADVAPVVWCKDCKHLSVWNRPDLYAHCPKTNTVFIPFEIDTRTHFCSYGDRKTEEENK